MRISDWSSDVCSSDLGVITDLYAQGFGAAIVRVDQCFSTPHEKGVGARDMQCAGQRRLKMHTVAPHPGSAACRGPDGDARQRLEGASARNFKQVLPELLLGVGVIQPVLGRSVHPKIGR